MFLGGGWTWAGRHVTRSGGEFEGFFDLAGGLDEGFFECDEGVHDGGVEVFAGAFDDDGAGDVVGERVFVDAFAGEGVVDVGEGDDAAAEGDGVGGEACGIAGAVPAFVVGGGDVVGHLEEAGAGVLKEGGFEGLCAERRVGLHDGVLAVAEAAGFEEDAVGDGDFADVVERGLV